jgi:type IV pilus biogenesis protein CpaD/CtpE
MRALRWPGRKPRKSLTILCVLGAGTVSGCAQTVAGTASQVCETWRPISISKHDKLTDQTAGEIAGNNAARAVWCTPPKKA